MKVTLLGPVTATAEGVELPLGGLKQRAVFVLMALNAGRVVAVDRLVDELWADEPPPRATLSLQSYVARLRRLLSDVPAAGGVAVEIVTRPPGWTLTLDPDQVDVTHFDALIGRARGRFVGPEPADLSVAMEVSRDLEEALALWSGEPLAGLEGVRFAREEAARLGELRLGAVELLLQTQLALGFSDAVAERARQFVLANPYRERGWVAYMLALYRCGRQSDALGAAAQLRRLLAAELGVDPSLQVRNLEERILRQDPDLATSVLSASSIRAGGAAHRPEPVARVADLESLSPLVGRDPVLASVDAAVQRATAGAGRLLVLEGPAGLGKSSILAEIEARVVDRGGTVVRGDSVGAGSAPSLWPWVSIARRLAAGIGPDGRPGERGTGTAEVALALLQGRTPTGVPLTDAGGAASRMRVFRAVLDALADEQVCRPLVVVMDDLQWADADTLTLLSLAVDELVGEGVLFAVAVRSDEPDADAVLGVIQRLRRNDVQHMSLAPLGIREVSTLIRAVSGAEAEAEVASAVHARTAGNPLFVRELIRLLNSEHRLDADGVRVTLPAEVADVLRRRLGRLPQQTVALLSVISVAGGPARTDILADVTGLDPDAVLDGCEAAILAGLLLDDLQHPGSVVLSHDLVRQTLEQSLSTARRLRLHARLADALLARGPMESPQIVEVARHLTLAAPVVGPAAAVPHLLAASDDALSRCAHLEAERHLRTALELISQLPAALEREALEGPVWARLTVLQLTVRGTEAAGPITAHVVAPPTDAGATLGWLAGMIEAIVTGQAPQAAVAAEAVLADAALSMTRFSAHFVRGFASHLTGRIDAARDDFEAMQDLADQGVDVQIPGFLDGAVASLAEAALIAHIEGDDPRADALLDRAANRSAGSDASLVVTEQHRLWLSAMRRDAVRARRSAADCRSLAKRLDYALYGHTAELVGAWADAVLGEAAGAQQADLAFERYLATGLRMLEPLYLLLRAEAHAVSGQHRQARELIRQSRAVEARTGEVCSSPRLLAWAEEQLPTTGR